MRYAVPMTNRYMASDPDAEYPDDMETSADRTFYTWGGGHPDDEQEEMPWV